MVDTRSVEVPMRVGVEFGRTEIIWMLLISNLAFAQIPYHLIPPRRRRGVWYRPAFHSQEIIHLRWSGRPSGVGGTDTMLSAT